MRATYCFLNTTLALMLSGDGLIRGLAMRFGKDHGAEGRIFGNDNRDLKWNTQCGCLSKLIKPLEASDSNLTYSLVTEDLSWCGLWESPRSLPLADLVSQSSTDVTMLTLLQRDDV